MTSSGEKRIRGAENEQARGEGGGMQKKGESEEGNRERWRLMRANKSSRRRRDRSRKDSDAAKGNTIAKERPQ